MLEFEDSFLWVIAAPEFLVNSFLTTELFLLEDTALRADGTNIATFGFKDEHLVEDTSFFKVDNDITENMEIKLA